MKRPAPNAEADEWAAWYQDEIARLREQLAQMRHDRDALAENLRDIRDAVWRLGTNEMLQRYNED